MNYGRILKKAYATTINHPGLWLLGLFLSGGFNANFFYLANVPLGWRDRASDLMAWLQGRTDVYLFVGLLAAAGSAAIITIIANWAKIVFVLRVSYILQLQRMKSSEEIGPMPPKLTWTIFQESPRFLVSVVALSIFTLICMTVALGVLGASPSLLFNSRGPIWGFAAAVFLALVFFFSCLNIFGTFFVIFYRYRFATALNLAFDLIFSRLRHIVEMVIILSIIYGLCFFVGTALVSFLFIPAVGIVILWIWLAIVNTFFNVSLLLFFTELVQPPTHPEFQSLEAKTPAPMLQ